jgi:hypothetical protein
MCVIEHQRQFRQKKTFYSFPIEYCFGVEVISSISSITIEKIVIQRRESVIVTFFEQSLFVETVTSVTRKYGSN